MSYVNTNTWLNCDKLCKIRHPHLSVGHLFSPNKTLQLIYIMREPNQEILIESIEGIYYDVYIDNFQAEALYSARSKSNITPDNFEKSFERYKKLQAFK